MAKVTNFKFSVSVNATIGSFSYEKELKEGRKHIEAMEGFDFGVKFDTELGELHVEGKEIGEACEGLAKAISEVTRAEADKAFAKARARAEEARANSEIRMREDEEWCRRHQSSES